MSNNNNNFSIPNNNNNGSNFTGGEHSGSNNSSSSSVANFILFPVLSLTIIFAAAYIIIVLIRPTFRSNKLNWFTINVCITSALLSSIMLLMTTTKVMNQTSLISCRIQGFLQIMAVYQVMYSHAVVAVSRFLTIVYANKRIFHSTICIWIFLGFGWLIAFLAALPQLFMNGFVCSNSAPSTFLVYYTFVSILIIPIMIVLVCNIRIFLFVRRSSQRVHAEGRGNNISQARDVHLIKTLIITFTVFVAGWTPLFVEQAFINSSTISPTVDTVFQILPQFSMLCDVILLIYINQPIRLFLWKLIVKRCRVIPDNTLSNTIKTNAHIIHKH